MKVYKLEFSKKFNKQLSKLDNKTKLIIEKWIDKNLRNTTDPTEHGKPLLGNLSGYWRYRVGDYRLIATIHNNELILHFVEVVHRKDSYK